VASRVAAVGCAGGVADMAGDAPQDYARYWYYRVAHPEVLKERRANEAAATKQRDAALGEMRARGVAPDEPHTLTLDEAKEELAIRLSQPESEQLQEFNTLEGRLDWNGERASWWAAYTFAPPIVV
jgi:hypothetical protein